MQGVLGALKRRVDFIMFRILRYVAGVEKGDERQSWGGGSGSQGSITPSSPERQSGGDQGNRREPSTEAAKVSAESGDSLLRSGEAALGG